MSLPIRATVVGLRGRDGACDIVFETVIPHGKSKRRIDVPVSPEIILALADAIRCCPEILETPATGRTGPGPKPIYKNLRHAIWHLQHPQELRPCLPVGTRVIDMDDRALPARPEGDEEP